MVEEFNFKSSTGKRLYGVKWFDEKRSDYCGVVQLIHGMEEWIRRYDNFAEYLAENGFVVVGHDHLGHGKSVENESMLGDYDCEDGWFRLVDDIHILQKKTKQEYPDIPYFVLGHSMGSMLARTYAIVYNDPYDGLIISGTSGQVTMLGAGILLTNLLRTFKGPKYKSTTVEGMVTGAFNKQFAPAETGFEWMTKDTQILQDFLAKASPNRFFTVESFRQMFKGLKFLKKEENYKKTKKVPVLIFSGAEDPVGENGKGVERVYQMLQKAELPSLEMKLYPGDRHETLNELDREQVYADVLNWIRKVEEQ